MVILPNLFVGRKKLRTFIYLRKRIIIISGQTLQRFPEGQVRFQVILDNTGDNPVIRPIIDQVIQFIRVFLKIEKLAGCLRVSFISETISLSGGHDKMGIKPTSLPDS